MSPPSSGLIGRFDDTRRVQNSGEGHRIVASPVALYKLFGTAHTRVREFYRCVEEVCGAEEGVVSSLSILDEQVRFVRAVPDSVIGTAYAVYLQSSGINVDTVARIRHTRIGIYFLETATNQCASSVFYNRERTAFFRRCRMRGTGRESDAKRD